MKNYTMGYTSNGGLDVTLPDGRVAENLSAIDGSEDASGVNVTITFRSNGKQRHLRIPEAKAAELSAKADLDFISHNGTFEEWRAAYHSSPDYFV